MQKGGQVAALLLALASAASAALWTPASAPADIPWGGGCVPLAEGAERTEYKGDVNSSSFSAWWFKGDRVVAAFVMNRPDAEREAASQLSGTRE